MDNIFFTFLATPRSKLHHSCTCLDPNPFCIFVNVLLIAVVPSLHLQLFGSSLPVVEPSPSSLPAWSTSKYPSQQRFLTGKENEIDICQSDFLIMTPLEKVLPRKLSSPAWQDIDSLDSHSEHHISFGTGQEREE